LNFGCPVKNPKSKKLVNTEKDRQEVIKGAESMPVICKIEGS